MLSQSTRADLEGERERLKRRMDAIDALLHVESAPEPPRAPKPQVKARQNASPEGPSLVALIREIVSKGEGPTVGDLVTKITALGFRAEGKTPLRTRLTGELGRMRRGKELKRKGIGRSGRYYLAVQANEGAEPAA